MNRPIPDPRLQRYRAAYLAMSPFYRPQAPGDGFGHICLSREELNCPARLEDEATKYAIAFSHEEDGRDFNIGCSNFETNRAFIWTIEAARVLAGGDNDTALKLLKLAMDDVKSTQQRSRKVQA
jgi:hypothetical protein